jgi:hypothetical protein
MTTRPPSSPTRPWATKRSPLESRWRPCDEGTDTPVRGVGGHCGSYLQVGCTVELLPENVGVTGMSCRLLNHVGHDPAQ